MKRIDEAIRLLEDVYAGACYPHDKIRKAIDILRSMKRGKVQGLKGDK